MSQNFLPCERDQQYLIPVSLRAWLPEDHFAWFVLDAVGQMDLATSEEREAEMDVATRAAAGSVRYKRTAVREDIRCGIGPPLRRVLALPVGRGAEA